MKEELVDLLQKDYSIRQIAEELNLTKTELIKYSYKLIHDRDKKLSWEQEFMLRKYYLENAYFQNFKTGKILFLSDMHIGSIYENESYLEQAKEYIKKEKIKTVIDGGDIGDGLVKYSRNYSTYDKQIEHILKVYPFVKGVRYYQLGGNHDKRYKNKGIDILEALKEEYGTIYPVGYYQAYFKIKDKIISLEHNSKMKDNRLIQKDFSILGHGHECKLEEKKIHLPTLSDSMPSNESPAGFVTMQIRNQDCLVEFMETTKGKITKQKEKIYFKRKSS